MIEVIVMTYYMSGDRNTIASALHLNKTWCVLIVGVKSDPRSQQLEAFFQAKVGAKRVQVIYVDSKEEAGKLAGLAKRSYFAKEVNEKWVPDEEKNARREEFVKLVAKLFNTGAVKLSPPGNATASIGDWFGKKPEAVRDSLREFWSEPKYEKQFEAFLQHLGFHAKQSYAFLWSKSGEVTAEKAHHFTDPISWEHLALEIAKRGWMPVVVGDAIGVITDPSLVKFWDEWLKLFGEPLPRDRQLALWAYIARVWGDRCCSIGMRSGMLEVPGLVGIRTLFMEEVANQQRARMAQWLMKVTGWCRAILPEPPGLAQSGYWLRHMLSHQSEFGSVLKYLDASSVLKARKTELTVYLIWVLQEATQSKLDQTIMQTICEYVDFDVRVAKYALSLSCVRMVADWVEKPEMVYQIEGMEDRLVEKVLTKKLLEIQGNTALQKKLPAPKLKALPNAVDPWPNVKVNDEVSGTHEELEKLGFDKATLQKMQIGKTYKVQNVAWKYVRVADGTKHVMQRMTMVLG